MNNAKIYIAHYPKLIERKEYITNIFKNEDIKDYAFFENYNQEDIDEKIDKMFFDDTQEKIVSKLKDYIPQNVIQQFLKDKLNKPEKSLGLKHKFIYNDFLMSSDKEYLIIFEDDIKFVNNFKLKLNKLLEENNPNWDILLFGAGVNLADKNSLMYREENIQKYFYQKLNHHAFGRGCDSYIVRRSIVIQMRDYFNSIKMNVPIDWELSYFANKVKVFGSYPLLTYQGSATNEYQSSIRERKNLYDG